MLNTKPSVRMYVCVSWVLGRCGHDPTKFITYVLPLGDLTFKSTHWKALIGCLKKAKLWQDPASDFSVPRTFLPYHPVVTFLCCFSMAPWKNLFHLCGVCLIFYLLTLTTYLI